MTEGVPAFFSQAIFGPKQVPPPGPFTSHADLVLRMGTHTDYTVPSVAGFAPRLDFVPAHLPTLPPQDLNTEASLFKEIRQTYELLAAISRSEPAPPPRLAFHFPSTSNGFSLNPSATAFGSSLTEYRDAPVQDLD